MTDPLILVLIAAGLILLGQVALYVWTQYKKREDDYVYIFTCEREGCSFAIELSDVRSIETIAIRHMQMHHS